MGKVYYNNILFDSDLEVEYYKKLMKDRDVINFTYHPKKPIQITKGNYYTPDFIVYYSDEECYLRCEIIETKGYNPYSKMKDDMTHQIMLQKSEQELKEWLKLNELDFSCPVKYRKIKFLQAYGFVDWDFKNPNTQINKARNKIKTQKEELKELKEFKKNALRFFNYWSKQQAQEKLTKAQKEWFDKYVLEIKEQI